jgi:hypothetical protein
MEGAKVVTIESDRGPVLVSADVHGHYDDFARLRDIFLASDAAGDAPVWISVGDWVHGPSDDGRRDVTDRFGHPLYDYPDRTPEILDELFALEDRFVGRVLSLCGNHEYAHIGGPRTRKFHDDEAAHLESRMSPAAVAELRRRFASWPIVVRLASCGVAITHGAPFPASAAEIERVRYVDNGDDERGFLHSAMCRYGFNPGEDRDLLARLGDDRHAYDVLIHGHDREEDGYAPNGEAALLLCTSFGARRDCKTYAWLDRATRYRSLADLRPDIELRRLWHHAGVAPSV